MASIIPRHDHSSMAGMSMGAGVPSLPYMQKIFWAFIGTAIAVATLGNVLNKILCYQRIKASRRDPTPAKPKSFFFQVHATTCAILREFGYYSPPLSFRKKHFYIPPSGGITMIVGYAVLIVVCSLYALNPNELLEWEDIGYRAGFIAICQIPLVILLAGKRNIIGLLTGMGFERLTWLHRWVARCLFLTVLIHMGFWLNEWGHFQYIMVKIKGDVLTQRGIISGGILLWIMLSSVAPIRGLSYEIFVIQHILSWIAFITAVYFHVPAENKIWIWLPIGFWAFDRFVRAVYLFYSNLSILHKNSSGIIACKATFEPLDESHTRITIPSPPITWTPGQHLFLACHVVAPLSSHPFTICSLPSDNKMEFIVRAKKGATKRFFKYAEKAYPSLPSTSGAAKGRSVLIDGPYSRIRPLKQFDSLLFIAGSTGATFTVPLLRSLIEDLSPSSSKPASFLTPSGSVVRYIRFIWVLKKRSSLSWFESQLSRVLDDVAQLKREGREIEVEINIFITCDEEFTSSSNSVTSLEKGETNEKGFMTTETEQCCCTRTLPDTSSDTISISAPCACSSSPTTNHNITKTLSTSTSSSLSKSPPSSPLDTRLSIRTGRPTLPSIIRHTAEQAYGEMGVVVCGPPGMVQVVRNAVVSVSDERGVHKGTGAQGIWCHGEGFGYA